MKALNACRRTEVKQGDTWVPVHWEQLDKGDIIRMFEPASLDGTTTQVHFEGVYTDGILIKQPALHIESPTVVHANIISNTGATEL